MLEREKKLWFIFFGLFFIIGVHGQIVLNLDSCRNKALTYNKKLEMQEQGVISAHYKQKAASTNFLPKLSATGSYIHNSRSLSILNDKQKLGLNNLGTTVNGVMQEAMQKLATHPGAISLPLLMALKDVDLVTPLNRVGNGLVDAFETDTRNVLLGAVTITQPIYMGGKIRAYNKITKFAEKLAYEQKTQSKQEVIISVDQIYWQIVSLANKQALVESYLNLIEKLEADIDKMVKEGIATKADALSVKVKHNEAELSLTRVIDAVKLSRMLLCQICGMDLNLSIKLADENLNISEKVREEIIPSLNMNHVYSIRPEVRALSLAHDIYKQKINIERAEHLPSISLVGNYLITNPSMYNGFENKFKGMWNVGIMFRMPIWSWREGHYKVKAAKAEYKRIGLQLEEAKEKIELQVTQSRFKVNEANIHLAMTQSNMDSAEENLRTAHLGFQEGVIPTRDLLAAQTAWLAAQSAYIDALIEVKLTNISLKKALGILE